MGGAGRAGTDCLCHPDGHDNGADAGITGNVEGIAGAGICRGAAANGTHATAAGPR
jgi:hypothetical protein